MRLVVNSLKWLGIFLLVALVALLTLPLLPVLQDRFGAGSADRYIAEHAVPLDFEEADLGLDLPQAILNKRFIMLGEIHGYADAQVLDLGMMAYLHQETGWRVYLAEVSPAQAIAFNEYILGGSDHAARAVFDQWSERAAQWGNREFFGKLTSIRSFNEAQPEHRRIVFVGVDFIAPEDAGEWLDNHPGPAAPPGFGSTASIEAINYTLLEEIRAREPVSRYGEILANIERVLIFPGGVRERFYGLWGLYHVGQVETAATRPLAMHLGEEGGPLEGEVATISSLCITECLNLMPAGALPSFFHGPGGEPYTAMPMAFDNPYLVRLRGHGQAMRAMEDAPGILLPLREDGSPFFRGQKLLGQTGYLSMLVSLEYDGSAAEAFDALILHQGSSALTPWQGEVFDVSGAMAKE